MVTFFTSDTLERPQGVESKRHIVQEYDKETGPTGTKIILEVRPYEVESPSSDFQAFEAVVIEDGEPQQLVLIFFGTHEHVGCFAKSSLEWEMVNELSPVIAAQHRLAAC